MADTTRVYLPTDVVPASPPARSIRLTAIGTVPADTTPPSTPTGLTSNPGNAQITYGWTAATDDVAVDHYNVRRGGTLVGSPVSTSYVLTGLTNGIAVADATVSAVDAAGNESAQVTFPTATPAPTGDVTAPTTPSNFTVTPGSAQNVLSWSASTDAVGVTGYRIRRGGTVLTTTASTTYTDTGLTNGTAYSYTVTAYDAAGNESAQTSAVSGTPAAPAAGTFFEDFSASTIGATPTGWTEPATGYDASGNFLVQADASGGRLLAISGGSGRRAASWDSPSNAANNTDAEIVFKWRIPTGGTITNASLRGVIRGAGTSSNTTMMAGGVVSETETTAANYISNTADSTSRAPWTTVAGQWYITRVRVSGLTQTVRTWNDGATEPATWDITKTFTGPSAAGWIGFMIITGAGERDVKWVGVGVNGATAPKGT